MSTLTTDITGLIFGTISIFMSIAIEFPQLVTIFKTKNTSGTSLTTYALFLLASFLWITWASLNYAGNLVSVGSDVTNLTLHIWALIPAVISNLVNVIFVSCIFFLKIKHVRKSKKLNITEFKYSQILFDNAKGQSWIRKYYPLLIMALIALVICTSVILTLVYVIGFDVPQVPREEFDHKYKWIIFGVNTTAALFFEAVSWPQFVKSMRSKDTSGISLGWAIFFPLSCYVCFAYDLSLGISTDYHTVLASLICSGMVINTAVLVLKIKNVRNAKKLGISEWIYTKRYILGNKKKNKSK